MNALELAQKLAETRELIDQAIIKNCPIPVFCTDTEGSWSRINEPLEKLFDAGPGALLGMKWMKQIQDKADRRAYDAAIRARAEVATLELKLQRGDLMIRVYVRILWLQTKGFIGYVIPTCDRKIACPIHEYLLK